MKPFEKPSEEDSGEFEECVICGKVTLCRKNVHIELRDFYIEGAGQCCEECYVKTYGCN